MTAAEHLERVRGWLRAQGWDLPEGWAECEDMGEVLAITNVPQGSGEWHFLRCGLLTASVSGLIMTPKAMKASEGRKGLMARLIGEQLIGEPYDWGKTGFTERGHEQEPHARAWYELERGVKVRQVGFLLSKDGKEGGSPDGLVGDDGLVEIKCYGLDHHMRVLMGVDLLPENPGQVQSLMRLTGRKWCDCVAYHPSPKIPNRLERVLRDDVYIGKLNGCVNQVKREMAEARTRLEAFGSARIDSNELSQLLTASLNKKASEELDAVVDEMYGEAPA